MFCSNCGKTVPDNLNYCSGCGAPTDNIPTAPDARSGRLFIVCGTFIVLIGLIAFYPIMRTLIESPIETAAKVLIILSYLSTVLLMFGVTMAMAWKQVNAPNPHRRTRGEKDEYRAPASFRNVNTSQLPSGDPGLGSVIDSTTRTLNEVLIERK